MNKHYNIKSLSIMSMAFWVFTIFFTNFAEAKMYTIKGGETRGSSITSYFHFGTGDPPYYDNRTSLSTFSGKDSLGYVSGQISADYDFSIGGSCEADENAAYLAGFTLAIAKGVLNYDKGQLFLSANSGSGCLKLMLTDVPDPFDGPVESLPFTYVLTVTYDIIGGSGEFAGADGTLISTSTGTLLWNYTSAGDDNQFGSVTSTYEGSFEANGN